jgi:hypothetical protein
VAWPKPQLSGAIITTGFSKKIGLCEKFIKKSNKVW